MWRALLPDEPPGWWRALLLGGGLAGAATLARIALEAPLGSELPFIAFFPALIIAAALGGIVGGVTCLLLSSLAAWLLFLPDGTPLAWAIGSFWISGGLIIAVASALADSVRELKRSRRRLDEAQAKLQTLVSELAHRNRNALAVIMSIVSQSARRVASADEAVQIINERLDALARSQQVVLENKGACVPLSAVIETALAPFGPERFAIAPSPAAFVEPDLAAPLGLVLHELATNALKYGALLSAEGRVALGWAPGYPLACLSWRESGGSAVAEPARTGFGTRLLGAALAPHGGRVERRFDPEGVTCDMLIPLARPLADPEK